MNGCESSSTSGKCSVNISGGKISWSLYHTSNVADKNNSHFNGNNSNSNAIVNTNNIKDDNITSVKNIGETKTIYVTPDLNFLQSGAAIIKKLDSFWIFKRRISIIPKMEKDFVITMLENFY